MPWPLSSKVKTSGLARQRRAVFEVRAQRLERDDVIAAARDRGELRFEGIERRVEPNFLRRNDVVPHDDGDVRRSSAGSDLRKSVIGSPNGRCNQHEANEGSPGEEAVDHQERCCFGEARVPSAVGCGASRSSPAASCCFSSRSPRRRTIRSRSMVLERSLGRRVRRRRDDRASASRRRRDGRRKACASQTRRRLRRS